jgi:hypothetical protein
MSFYIFMIVFSMYKLSLIPGTGTTVFNLVSKTSILVFNRSMCEDRSKKILPSVYLLNTILAITIIIPQNSSDCVWKAVSKVGKEISKSEKHLPPPSRSMTTYSAHTNIESAQDQAKKPHPVVVKDECNSEKCKTTNCANDKKECDLETNKSAIIGHITHVPQNVESDRKIIQMAGTNVVIYPQKEPIEDKGKEDYHLSKHFQKDSNNDKLNKATKDQTEYNNNSNENG